MKLSETEKLGRQTPDFIWNNPDQIQYVKDVINDLGPELIKLNLPMSVRKLQAIQSVLDMDRSGYDTTTAHQVFSARFTELQSRIVDELDSRKLLTIDPLPAKYIEASIIPFGSEVSDKFPEAMTDLSEASICLGISRGTACVFHLMRAMETAVQAICKELGVKNVSKEWGKLLSDIKTSIEEMDKGQQRDKWSETLSLLYHVKQSWRNGTMHPKQTYTPEEATEVFEATKGFMKNLTKMVS